MYSETFTSYCIRYELFVEHLIYTYLLIHCKIVDHFLKVRKIEIFDYANYILFVIVVC